MGYKFYAKLIKLLYKKYSTVKIKSIDIKNDSDEILLRASVTKYEFKQLKGSLENIGIFSTDRISLPANITKTGAKNKCAKWLLLPVKLRTDYKIDEYDWENLTCGRFENEDNVFFIYKVGKKLF